MHVAASSIRKERLLVISTALTVLVSMMVMTADPALAHHPNLEGSVVCIDGDPVVSYRAFSWTSANQGGRYNSDIGIYVDDDGGTGFDGDESEIGSGSFLPGVGDYATITNAAYGQSLSEWGSTSTPAAEFSGTFVATAFEGTSIYIKSRADDNWWNNQPAGDDSDDVVQVNVPVCDETVAVSANPLACASNEQDLPQGSVSFTIDPDSAATVTVYSDAGHNDAVSNTLGNGESVSLAPGTYFWQATAGQGYKFSDSSNTDSGQFTIAPCEATVLVSHNNCVVEGAAIPGSVTVSIDPTSGATVVVGGPGGPYSFIGSGGNQSLAAGEYTWSATSAAGFELSGETSGSFTVDPCTSSVAVGHSQCVVNSSSSAVGSVDVAIAPDSGAIVYVYDDAAMQPADLQATLTGTGGTHELAPGTYHWNAQPGGNFTLTGETSGSFAIEPCGVTVAVTIDGCMVGEGGATGAAEVSITPSSGAIVKIYTDQNHQNEVAAFSGSGGSAALAPGFYYWVVTPSSGFDVEGATSGSFTIEPCSASVVVGGACVIGQNGQSGVIGVAMGDGVDKVDVYDGAQLVGVLTASGSLGVPEGRTYTWVATQSEGFDLVGVSSGVVAIDDCVLDSTVVVTHGNCVDATFPNGQVSAEIDPEGAAKVTILDDELNAVKEFDSSGTVPIAPGDYTWTAAASAGYELVGASNGSFTVDACPDEVLAVEVLPFTGFESDKLLAVGLGLLMVGWFALNAAKRRKDN